MCLAIGRVGFCFHGVDDIFAVGIKAICDQLCEDLDRLVPINDLGE